MELVPLLRKILLANELGGNAEAAYRFSDADGPQGRSGYSFGLCQFDLSHNREAETILGQCGFTPSEITALKRQEVDARQYNQRLAAQRDVIDAADRRELAGIISHVRNVERLKAFRFADELAVLAAADYHNQFYMSINGKLATYCALLGRPVTHADIFDFVLHQTAWGKKRPDDVRRRHSNVRRIWDEATA